MRRYPLALAALALVLTAVPAVAKPPFPPPGHNKPPKPPVPPSATPAAPTGLTANVVADYVALRWNPVDTDTTTGIAVYRDGRTLAYVPATARVYDDHAVSPNDAHTYWLVALNRNRASRPSVPARVTLPAYLVGAATYDISPDLIGLGLVNEGGFGLGNGTGISPLVGRGHQGVSTAADRIRTRAVVFDDGHGAVAIATIETQGYFAAYRDGLKGLADMAAAAANSRMPADHILITSDHTHSGPDTIGAWGGMPKAYFDFVYARTAAAIRDAYAGRVFADV